MKGEKSEGAAAWPVAAAASALAVAVGLAGAFEWDHYRQLLKWKSLGLRPWDKGFLFWLVCAKTLWLLTPLLLAAAALRRAGWRRAAVLLFAGGSTLLSV